MGGSEISFEAKGRPAPLSFRELCPTADDRRLTTSMTLCSSENLREKLSCSDKKRNYRYYKSNICDRIRVCHAGFEALR